MKTLRQRRAIWHAAERAKRRRAAAWEALAEAAHARLPEIETLAKEVLAEERAAVSCLKQLTVIDS
ncbi:MAG: hypothetical protein AB7F78_13680 [Hyphomicrobiaceae bacterium]